MLHLRAQGIVTRWILRKQPLFAMSTLVQAMIYIGRSGYVGITKTFIVTHDSEEDALKHLQRYLEMNSTYQCNVLGQCRYPKEYWESSTVEETTGDMVIEVML